MPRYPYKTLKEIDGVQYITVQEAEQIVSDTLALASTYSQVRKAVGQITEATQNLTKVTQELLEVNPEEF